MTVRSQPALKVSRRVTLLKRIQPVILRVCALWHQPVDVLRARALRARPTVKDTAWPSRNSPTECRLMAEVFGTFIRGDDPREIVALYGARRQVARP